MSSSSTSVADDRICNACVQHKARPSFTKKQWVKKFRRCNDCVKQEIPFQRPGKRKKKSHANSVITVRLQALGDKFHCDLNKETLKIVKIHSGADPLLKPGFRLQGYSSFDDVVKHISTGPYPLQITFEASIVKNSQPNLSRKTTRKERETLEDTKPSMVDDVKREETSVSDTANSKSAINVDDKDDDDDKKADDRGITPLDADKVVRKVEYGDDKVEDGGKSSLANKQHSKKADASPMGGFWSLSSSPIVRQQPPP